MKKKIFGAALIAAMALAAGWNFNQSKNEVELSDLALANVEALAQRESGNKLYESYCSRAGTQCRASSVTGPTCSHPWSCP